MSKSNYPVKIVTALIVCAVAAGSYLIGRSRGVPHAGASVTSTMPSSADTAATLWTCSMHPQVIQDKPGVCPICHMELVPLKRSGDTREGVLQIDPAIVQNMGVRTAVVGKGSLVRSVRVVGYLEEPEPLHRDINLRVNGWIEKLYADTDGMVVTKGMPLFDLYSPELTVAVDEFISARKQPSGDATARSFVDSSRRKLLQYGLEESQVDALAKLETAPRTVPFLSAIDGHLTAKMVYEGASVKAGDLVLRLASRHRMWIDAQVYEQQMSLISDGQPARITLVSQPGKTFEGKVLFVHPHVDPRTRTALARIEVPNQDMSLRQGMYATVDILADSYAEATVLPREAVIDTGRKQLAFVSLGEGKFEPRLLTLGGAGQDGTVEVIAGVQPGEVVVTSGQFLLDSESRVREAIAKFGSDAVATIGPTPATRPATVEGHKEAPTVAIPHSGELIDDYLAIAKQLGEREADDAKPIDLAPLIDRARTAATHANADAKPIADRLLTAAEAMNGKPLAEQREAFLQVSKAAMELVESSAPGRTLYRMQCPMAFGAEGADWLQASDVIANPYYAKQMKSCGSVQKKYEPRKPYAHGRTRHRILSEESFPRAHAHAAARRREPVEPVAHEARRHPGFVRRAGDRHHRVRRAEPAGGGRPGHVPAQQRAAGGAGREGGPRLLDVRAVVRLRAI